MASVILKDTRLMGSWLRIENSNPHMKSERSLTKECANGQTLCNMFLGFYVVAINSLTQDWLIGWTIVHAWSLRRFGIRLHCFGVSHCMRFQIWRKI